MRFESVEGGGAGFAKVFDSDIGRRIHHESLALWDAAVRGEIGFRVARPDRWDPLNRALWQGVIEGEPVVPSRLFGREESRLCRQIGYATASLTQCNLKPRKVFDREALLKKARRHALELGRRIPMLIPDLGVLLETLGRIHASSDRQRLRPIHSDLHPRQWLDNANGLGLVDFDGLALGDPEYDVATFLTELEFKDKGRGQAGVASNAFIDGYESAAEPLDRKLLTLSRAHAWLVKALRAACKLRPDGGSRAERYLLHAQSYASEIEAEP